MDTPFATDASVSEFIVGGSPVEPTDPIYPSTVLLDAGTDFCTGTMVSADLVVTAAHCVTYGPTHASLLPLDALRVSFPGTYGPHGIVRWVHVGGFEVNPLWTPQSAQEKDQADIAAVRMVGNIPANYRAADVWPETVPLQPGNSVVLAGFGVTTVQSSVPTGGVLRKASVPVEDPDFSQTEVQLDQSRGAGACYGDSGGPSFVEAEGHTYFWGVASRGDADCVHRAFYTRVAPYWDWLRLAAVRLGAAEPRP